MSYTTPKLLLTRLLACCMVICLAPSIAKAQTTQDVMRTIELRNTQSKVIDPSQILSEEIGFDQKLNFGSTKLPAATQSSPSISSAPPAPSQQTPVLQTSTPTTGQQRFQQNGYRYNSTQNQNTYQYDTPNQSGFQNSSIQTQPTRVYGSSPSYSQQQDVQIQTQPFVQQPTQNQWSTNTPSGSQQTGAKATLKSVSASSIQTQIIAPRFINVNEQTQLSLKVENVGAADVSNVRLIAVLPAHAKFVAATPKPTRVNGNEYEFSFDTLAARKKQFIRLDIKPTTKAPMDISTNVQIASTQRVAVRVRQPILEMNVKGPARVQTGQTFKNIIRVKNVGDGFAEKVLLRTQLPEQISEAPAPQRVYIDRLGPGQEVRFEVVNYAKGQGQGELGFEVSAKGAEPRTRAAAINVVQAELQVLVAGPDQNFIHQDGIYTIKLQNKSQVKINDVHVEVAIPRGLKVNTINRQTSNNSQQGTLIWKFKEFPINRTESIQFRASALTEGEQNCRVVVRTKEIPAKEFKIGTFVSSRPDVSISIRDAGQPVGIGSKVDFTIELNNRGGRAAEQSEVVVDLPHGLSPVEQSGYVINQGQNQIMFQNVTVKANHTTTLRFRCAAREQGDHIVRGTIHMPGARQGVSAEDSVFVFESKETKVSDALKPELRR